MDKFKHKKSLGQNFLKDENVLNNIVSSVNLTKDDLVIEIGPGQGALTKKLQEKNVNLICFEIDERTKPFLEKIKTKNTKIFYQDFLTADLNSILKEITYKNLFIIANIPYYITTPIIKKIINEKLPITAMVLMVQNEVADRFNAKVKTKNYNSLTIYLNYYFNIQKLFVVPNTCFDPVPKVDSAVIKFEIQQDKFYVENEELFFKLVQDSFRYKRKNIKNNLQDYDLNIIENILKKYNLNLQSRAEEIDINIFVEIANKLSKY